MTTHDLARALSLLARMLKSGPSVELKDWKGPEGADADPGRNGSSAANKGLALNVLLELSRYSKSQWRNLFDEWKLPVDIRPSDSVRDLVGRLLNYLDDNPDVAERIRNNPAEKATKASPELAKILSILVGSAKEEAADDEKRERKK